MKGGFDGNLPKRLLVVTKNRAEVITECFQFGTLVFIVVAYSTIMDGLEWTNL